MSITSLNLQHLNLRSAADVHEVFQRLGYDVFDPEPFEGADLDQLELGQAERDTVQRAYIVARRDGHTVYLFEVTDIRQTRLRGLALNALQRGTGLLVVTRDYREILFVDPRFVGSKTNKSSVRVNKLKLVVSDPTRHDLDTLNAIHAHRRSGQQIYDAQAEAFNVTTITRKFYDEYRRHYEHARAMIRHHNSGVADFQNSDQTDKLHTFTQRLLGRLMFLYFLQRKGWLGERQKFLTEKYNETMRQHSHELNGDNETFYYYREVLEPLFFQTLNTQRPDNITRWGSLRIPYLNGGLFDDSRDPAGPIIIPDTLFDPNSNEGLLAFFNRYNFTIEDDTPLEQDVSVDPEMLGKVFENMLEERDRGQSGSFYTPRTIVAYMCQEALISYLEESAKVPRETTRAQFDPDSEVRYTSEEAERVSTALDTLTVLDPAVGSGSFLIGMLNEIIRLRKACYAVLHEGQDTPSSVLADWKEAIIRDTLYGVDIKPEAIEIAQLRLWLALVVDQTLEQARPLPNLDYKLMAGNSLIETIDGEPVLGESAKAMMGADVTPKQPMLGLFETDKERFKLDKLRAKFFRATPEKRHKLREDISAQEHRIVATSLQEKADAQEQIINQVGKLSAQTGGKLKTSDERRLKAAVDKLTRLTKLQEDLLKPDYVLPFFLYRLHFSEVFERKGGFDVVVANPPYVRGEKIGDQKKELKVTAIYEPVYSGTADLYVYFYVRALDLLRKRGHLAFITSNKFIRAKYGTGLRAYLADHADMRDMIDFGELPVFKEAATFPYILLANKDKPTKNTRFTQVQEWAEFDSVRELVKQNGAILPENAIQKADWSLADHSTARLLNKLIQAGIPLREYVYGQMYRGILTGFNKAFVIDNAKREELIAQDPKSAEIIKPFAVGDDVRKWRIRQDKWLILTRIGVDIERYPAIFAHLSQWQDKLEARYDKGDHWWELRACVYYDAFEQPKIIYPEMGKELRFAFDKLGTYLNNKAFLISGDNLYLFGVLNSNVVWEYLKNTTSVLGDPNKGGRLEMRLIYMETIPIPSPPDDLRQRIASLAQQCLDAAQDAPGTLPALESELNTLVYQAYGLDADEIALIEGSLADKQTASALDIDDGAEDEE